MSVSEFLRSLVTLSNQMLTLVSNKLIQLHLDTVTAMRPSRGGRADVSMPPSYPASSLRLPR